MIQVYKSIGVVVFKQQYSCRFPLAIVRVDDAHPGTSGRQLPLRGKYAPNASRFH
jgi:hypothetical protein